MTRNVKCLAFLVLISCFPARAQAPSATTPAIEARAEALLKQLSLEEKIDLIGGVNDFYIREIKHIGLPALKMADGPFGVRNYGPSTAFGGMGLAATWDPELVGAHGRSYRPGCARARRTFHAGARRQHFPLSFVREKL